jgi:hypothetical protein
VDINARLNGSNYIFDMGNANGFTNIEFESCTVRNVGRSVVRPNNAALNIDHISFNNCLLHTVGAGGYGCVVVGKDVPVRLISFVNTTVVEFGTNRLVHFQGGGVQQLLVDRVTFYNQKVKADEVFRFDDPVTAAVQVSNCIFAGNNGGTVKLKAGSKAYPFLLFTDCYVTADVPLDPLFPFTGATVLKLTSEELFEEPANGNFRIRRTYEGSGKAGDSRWW